MAGFDRNYLSHDSPSHKMYFNNDGYGLSSFGTPYQQQAIPKLSTFATKSTVDIRYEDDPNPYKVSCLDKYRIQVHNPYRSMSHRSYLSLHDSCDSASNASTPIPSIAVTDRNHHNCVAYDQVDLDDEELTMHFPDNHGTRRRSVPVGGLPYGSRSVSTNGSTTGDAECDIPIPEPDYDNDGISDDVPIPHVDSSEDYSSVSAASDPGASGSQSSPGPSATSSSSLEDPVPVDINALLTEAQTRTIKCLYQGLKTEVFVATSFATLHSWEKGKTEWHQSLVGVPVLILSKGGTRSRDQRQIQIAIAEVNSGKFQPGWIDLINHLSDYRVHETKTFHTMHCKDDHQKMVGIEFHDNDAASHFAHLIDELTSNFANINLSGAKTKKAKKSNSKPIKISKPLKPKKIDISCPCDFRHLSVESTRFSPGSVVSTEMQHSISKLHIKDV